MSGRVPSLVSPAWLAARLPAVKVVDASWYLPAMGRDGKAEYAARRIPGARHWDLDATDDPSDLPHMLPSPGFFADSMAALGVTSDDHIVAYDGKGIFSAPRLWWCLRAFGHDRASVLDGGLPAWVGEGHAVDEGPPPPPLGAGGGFDAALRPEAVWTRAQVAANLQDRAALVVDARALARFEGRAPEPRANCRSGRIPGSRCVPFTEVLTEDGKMKAEAELRAAFAAGGVDVAAAPALALSCGSGVTASVLALALDQLGVAAPVYDGSAAEWLSRDDTPIETGPVEEA